MKPGKCQLEDAEAGSLRRPISFVTYVQRLYTTGGLAPATPGTADGQQVLVPYSAEYLFYHAGTLGDASARSSGE